MKKIYYFAILMFATVLVCQSCKKKSDDATTDPATTTNVLQASVNGTSWAPTADSMTVTITYNAAKKTKTFYFTGQYYQKQVTGSVTLNNATNTNDFTTGAYYTDAAGAVSISYSQLQKNTDGSSSWVPIATSGVNDGSITLSSVSGGLINGSFSCSMRKTNYDNNGNVISVTNTAIASGLFSNLPYKFVSQ